MYVPGWQPQEGQTVQGRHQTDHADKHDISVHVAGDGRKRVRLIY